MNERPLEYCDEWSMPLHGVDSHLYAKMSIPSQIFYTSAQLRKLHRQFCHPLAEKLYNLLKTAGVEAVTPKTLEKLEHIARTCELC